ncbi:phosphate transport system permease protein [Desulfitispora alkaliphila]|uniref:phosphate ABC transporter permease subunit PstC n=1 Tax=Desulfitispora alkaliphila TaxID=622674 RepID=UPI003D223CB3
MSPKIYDRLFEGLVRGLALVAVLLLVFIVFFIAKESYPVFKQVDLSTFLLGQDWRPLSDPPRLSILPMLAATIAVSLGALFIALPVGLGCGLFLSQVCPPQWRRIIRPFLDIMAGIPSVVYGFLGVMLLIPLVEKYFDVSSGESLLCGSILLAIMILPFIISTCDETMSKAAAKYLPASKSLGVSRWYMFRHLLLPASKIGIISGAILGTARAMGETMAVMMVVGNAALMPTSIFERIKPIPALIALEMGSAPLGSLHYHALFAAGLVLMLLLVTINLIFYLIRQRLEV